jgi:hypothetical protein
MNGCLLIFCCVGVVLVCSSFCFDDTHNITHFFVGLKRPSLKRVNLRVSQAVFCHYLLLVLDPKFRLFGALSGGFGKLSG